MQHEVSYKYRGLWPLKRKCGAIINYLEDGELYASVSVIEFPAPEILSAPLGLLDCYNYLAKEELKQIKAILWNPSIKKAYRVAIKFKNANDGYFLGWFTDLESAIRCAEEGNVSWWLKRR